MRSAGLQRWRGCSTSSCSGIRTGSCSCSWCRRCCSIYSERRENVAVATAPATTAHGGGRLWFLRPRCRHILQVTTPTGAFLDPPTLRDACARTTALTSSSLRHSAVPCAVCRLRSLAECYAADEAFRPTGRSIPQSSYPALTVTGGSPGAAAVSASATAAVCPPLTSAGCTVRDCRAWVSRGFVNGQHGGFMVAFARA